MFFKTYKYLEICGLCLIFVAATLKAEKPDNKLTIGNFSNGSWTGWNTKEFKGQTQYQIVQIEGIQALKADSKGVASGLFYEQRIDLQKTPILNWRWRVEKPLANHDEQTKAGDDFAARVYVVVSGGLIFWNTKAINYVWSSTSPKQKTWPNPFAGDHAMMVAVRSSQDKTRAWYSEKRDIRADFKQLTGEEIRYIDAVAIMTDTDNSHGEATAYYGDVYFSVK
jgi:hypothetical protein